jgi:hypothetical protein
MRMRDARANIEWLYQQQPRKGPATPKAQPVFDFGAGAGPPMLKVGLRKRHKRSASLLSPSPHWRDTLRIWQ